MSSENPPRRIGLLSALVVLALLSGLLVGFATGFNIGQPSLVAESAGEVRAAAEALDQIALEAQRDPRGIGDQLAELRTRAATIRDRAARDGVLSRLDAIEQRLREQNDRLEAALWTTHEKARRVRQDLDARLDASSSPLVTGYDQLQRFMRWVGPVALLVLLFVIILLASPGARKWVASIRSVTAGPFAFNTHDPASVREGVRERFQQVDEAIAEAYRLKLENADVEDIFLRFKRMMDAQFLTVGVDLATTPHRATLWVPGFTGDELVQAANYHGYPAPEARPVVGRRFSVRYGIIGRAWRLRTSQYNWDVSNKANALVRNWGLTRREALKQGARQSSLMAFVIDSADVEDDPLGIVYLEAQGVNLLLPRKSVDELNKQVQGDPNGRYVADKEADDLIWKPLWESRKADPLISALMKLRRAFNWDLKVNSDEGR